MERDFFVHPHGLCESETVGSRTRIWAFAHVMAGAKVGSDCNICDHAYVEGRVVLGDNVTVKNGVCIFDGVAVGDNVFLGPNCVFTNDLYPRAAVKKAGDGLLATVVADGASVGANATIVCGVTVGAHSMVAAGAVVTRDVAPHALVAGVPAQRIGWVCSCGARIGESLVCGCGLRYRFVSDAEGLRRDDIPEPA